MKVQFTIDRTFPRGHKNVHVFVNGEAAGSLTLWPHELDEFLMALGANGHEVSDRDRTLTKQEIATLTGRQLMADIGLMDERGTWRDNEHVPFAMNGTEWTAYTTQGRGRHSGTTYLHIYRPVKVKIVDSFGTDTGQRVDDVEHVRGKAHEKISTYQWVD